MSTAAAEGGARRTSSRTHLVGEPAAAVAFQWSIVAVDVVILAVALAMGWVHVSGNWVAVVTFAGLVSVAGSLTVETGKASLGFDLPLLLAVGLLFGPFTAGIVALVAVFDIREFRGEVPLRLSLFNRAEVSLSAIAGTLAFFATGVRLTEWPWTAMAGILALGVDTFVNYVLVATCWTLKSKRPFLSVVREMRIGPPRSFVPAYACFGFLGVLIAELYTAAGLGAALAVVAAVALGRQAFAQRRRLDETVVALAHKERMLSKADERIVAERRDERTILAGELHDEVLPPLFQVHLMGQVLKQDLASGHLLDLDQDLPQLLVATDVAQGVVRELVKGLRLSPLGTGGLIPSIEALARQLEILGAPRMTLELGEVQATEQVKFVAYQVIREALRNAARYSRASVIQVRLSARQGQLLITVTDDGIGFDQGLIDQSQHFGLQLIRDRVAQVEGRLVIDSRLGSGTLVAASMPTGV